MVGGGFVDAFVKAELPKSVLFDIFAEGELVTDGDGKVAIVFDDFRDILSKPVVRVDLLSYKSSFFEISVKDLPHVVLGDLWFLGLDHG